MISLQTEQKKHDRVPWVRRRALNRKNEEGCKGNPIALCIANLGSASMGASLVEVCATIERSQECQDEGNCIH